MAANNPFATLSIEGETPSVSVGNAKNMMCNETLEKKESRWGDCESQVKNARDSNSQKTTDECAEMYINPPMSPTMPTMYNDPSARPMTQGEVFAAWQTLQYHMNQMQQCAQYPYRFQESPTPKPIDMDNISYDDQSIEDKNNSPRYREVVFSNNAMVASMRGTLRDKLVEYFKANSDINPAIAHTLAMICVDCHYNMKYVNNFNEMFKKGLSSVFVEGEASPESTSSASSASASTSNADKDSAVYVEEMSDA